MKKASRYKKRLISHKPELFTDVLSLLFSQINLRGRYGNFLPKNQFFIFAKCPSHCARLICKVPRSLNFFCKSKYIPVTQYNATFWPTQLSGQEAWTWYRFILLMVTVQIFKITDLFLSKFSSQENAHREKVLVVVTHFFCKKRSQVYFFILYYFYTLVLTTRLIK